MNSSCNLPAPAKYIVLDNCVSMCARDLQPLSTVAGDGFQDLAQKTRNGSTKSTKVRKGIT